MRAAPKNRLTLFAALAPALWAADVWEAKPFQDWTDKDLQKVVNNSPWARQTRALVGNASVLTPRGDTQPGISDASSSDAGSARAGGGAGGTGRIGATPGDFDPETQPSQQPGVPVIVRWQTALPLRQAQMRGKYGKEAATSPEAQKFLTQEPSIYVIGIAGLPGSIVSAGGGDQAKQNIAQKTTLSVKGKEALRPVAIDFVPNGSAVDVLIGFPRASPIAIEDQEVELASQIGSATVRYRFKLKDMVVRGRLEL